MLKFDGNVSVGGVIAGESRQESLKGIWMDFDKFSYTKALLQLHFFCKVLPNAYPFKN